MFHVSLGRGNSALAFIVSAFQPIERIKYVPGWFELFKVTP